MFVVSVSYFASNSICTRTIRLFPQSEESGGPAPVPVAASKFNWASAVKGPVLEEPSAPPAAPTAPVAGAVAATTTSSGKRGGAAVASSASQGDSAVSASYSGDEADVSNMRKSIETLQLTSRKHFQLLSLLFCVAYYLVLYILLLK